MSAAQEFDELGAVDNHDATSAPRRRAIYLRVDQVRMLDHWCESLRHTFERPVYLVGSVLRHDRWRDVDVRIVLSDKQVRRIPMRLRDLNMLLSRWGQDVTGLPIDCQVQSATEAAAEDGLVNPRGTTTYSASRSVRSGPIESNRTNGGPDGE